MFTLYCNNDQISNQFKQAGVNNIDKMSNLQMFQKVKIYQYDDTLQQFRQEFLQKNFDKISNIDIAKPFLKFTKAQKQYFYQADFTKFDSQDLSKLLNIIQQQQ